MYFLSIKKFVQVYNTHFLFSYQVTLEKVPLESLDIPSLQLSEHRGFFYSGLLISHRPVWIP